MTARPKISIKRFPAAGGSRQAQAVVLVHGAWHGAWCWEGGFIDALNRTGFDCFTVDLRGHGESEAVRAMRWNRIADYVDDVTAALQEIGGAPVLVGHSMGGYICQHVGNRHAKLSGICLLASAPHTGVFSLATRMMLKRPFAVLSTFLTLSLMPLIKSKDQVREMFLDADASDEDAEAFRLKLIDESFMGFLDMLVLDLPPKPTKHVPALVIGGEKDPLFPPSGQKALARRFDAECHIIDSAPHNLMSQRNWQAAAAVLARWSERLLTRGDDAA